MKLPREFTHELVKNAMPSMAYDGKESFTEWQTRARAKLSKFLGLDKIIPPKAKTDLRSNG